VHKPDIGCKSVYYAWVARVPKEVRIKLVIDFQFCGMPITAGYSKPLNHIFHSSQVCPMANRMQEELILFETCAYDPTRHQRKKMAEIVKYIVEKIDGTATQNTGRVFLDASTEG
jgi:hypothetical protein